MTVAINRQPNYRMGNQDNPDWWDKWLKKNLKKKVKLLSKRVK